MGPGYKHIIIQPHPTGKLSYSRASFESSYGTIASGWERKEGKIIIKVRIPANTSATIILPVLSQEKVTEEGKALSQNVYLKDIKTSDNKLTMQAGSGEYVFEIMY
jgi:alpha-L-rhamnosidase